jgi:hypothetical protein
MLVKFEFTQSAGVVEFVHVSKSQFKLPTILFSNVLASYLGS